MFFALVNHGNKIGKLWIWEVIEYKCFRKNQKAEVVLLFWMCHSVYREVVVVLQDVCCYVSLQWLTWRLSGAFHVQYVTLASRGRSIKTITKDLVWWRREASGIMGVIVFTATANEKLPDVNHVHAWGDVFKFYSCYTTNKKLTNCELCDLNSSTLFIDFFFLHENKQFYNNSYSDGLLQYMVLVIDRIIISQAARHDDRLIKSPVMSPSDKAVSLPVEWRESHTFWQRRLKSCDNTKEKDRQHDGNFEYTTLHLYPSFVSTRPSMCFVRKMWTKSRRAATHLFINTGFLFEFFHWFI